MTLRHLRYAVSIAAFVSAFSLQCEAAQAPLSLQTDAYFFAGGQYVKTPTGDVMDWQMYVHEMVPSRTTHALPVVMDPSATGICSEGANQNRRGSARPWCEEVCNDHLSC